VRTDSSYLRIPRVLIHICSYRLAFWLVQNSVNKTNISLMVCCSYLTNYKWRRAGGWKLAQKIVLSYTKP